MEGYKEGNKSEKGKFLWGDWDKGGETGQLGDEYIFQTTMCNKDDNSYLPVWAYWGLAPWPR